MTGKSVEIKGKLDLVWASGLFELSHLELLGFYYIYAVESSSQKSCCCRWLNQLNMVLIKSYIVKKTRLLAMRLP